MLKKNKIIISKILEQNDIMNKEFGVLQNLMCADDFKNLFNENNKNKYYQLVYFIKYKNNSVPFMYQMCNIATASNKNIILNDVVKYKEIANKYNAKISIVKRGNKIAKLPYKFYKNIWVLLLLISKYTHTGKKKSYKKIS